MNRVRRYIECRNLRHRTKENTPKFTFDNHTVTARIVDCYDGDTVTAIFRFQQIYYQFKIRLFGIDTPEIRTRDLEEKRLGYEARDFVRNLILDKIVTIECLPFDKYGRILGTIWHKGVCINELLLKNGMAKKYD